MRSKVSRQQGNLPVHIAWYQMLLLISKRYSKGDSMKLHTFLKEISHLNITLRVLSHCLSHLTRSKWVHASKNKLSLRIGRVDNMWKQIVDYMVTVPKLLSIILINLLQESTQAMEDSTLQIAKNLNFLLLWSQETLMEKAQVWLDPHHNSMKNQIPALWKKR